MVDVLEDMIVVDAPDIVRVTRPIEGVKVKEGDTILRYARLGEGFADFWADGCWYKDVDAGFIVEPDGGGCGGPDCPAKVTKMGRQSLVASHTVARRQSRLDIEPGAGFVGGRVGASLPPSGTQVWLRYGLLNAELTLCATDLAKRAKPIRS